MNRKRFIIGGGIPVVFAPFDHEEDGTQDFVRQGDDGTFVSTPNDERFEFRLEERPATLHLGRRTNHRLMWPR